MTNADRFPSIEKHLNLECSVEHAFRVFTKNISTWWPLESHSCFETKSDRVVIEEQVGGQIIEYSKEGHSAVWGNILSWQPPFRFSMTWHPSSPVDEATIVAVEFFKISDSSCRLKLVHSEWHQRKDPNIRGNYENGWDMVLSLFSSKTL